MDDKLTENDINMVHYYHFEKGDLRRWEGWKKRKDIIAKEFPFIISLIEERDRIESVLDSLIEKMEFREDQ